MIDETEQPRHPARERSRRKRRSRLPIVLAAVALVVFGLGVALGEALHDNPRPGGSTTVEHTLQLTVAPLRSP